MLKYKADDDAMLKYKADDDTMPDQMMRVIMEGARDDFSDK